MKLFSITETSTSDAGEPDFGRAYWCEHLAEAMERFGSDWKSEGGEWPDYTLTIVAKDVTADVPQGMHRTEPREETRSSLLRLIGFMEEGDSSCESCGRYPCGTEEGRVCDDCNLCLECCDVSDDICLTCCPRIPPSTTEGQS